MPIGSLKPMIIAIIDRKEITSCKTQGIYDTHPLATQLAACRSVKDVIRLFGDNTIVSVYMSLPEGKSTGP